VLSYAYDVSGRLAAKHDTDHGERLMRFDAKMQLDLSDSQDCRGERKEAESEHHSCACDSADLPEVRHR